LTGTSSIFNQSASTASVHDTTLDGSVSGDGFSCLGTSSGGVELGVNCRTNPDRVIWVAATGGDFTLLSTALASITDNSSTKPYVIKIAPGIYAETSTVALKDFVDIEGSGEDVTTITCACIGGVLVDQAVLSAGAITAEIRHLTVVNASSISPTTSVGIYTNGGTAGSLSLLHLTASGTTASNNYSVYNNNSSPTMTNVTATATATTNTTGNPNNYGVYNNNSSSPTMTNVTATATTTTNTTGNPNNYGVYNNNSSSPTMTNVTATATANTTTNTTNYGVYNNNSSSPTMTNVTATATDGSSQNFGVYNVSSSPTMTNVTATATGTGTEGSSFTYGVRNDLSSPTMTNVTATASGGVSNQGVTNLSSSSTTTMTNVTATASGGAQSVAVQNSSSWTTMTNVTATATGASDTNYGVTNGGAPTRIRNSAITGDTNSIFGNGTTNIYVGNTMLNGPVDTYVGSTADFNCFGVHTFYFQPLNSICK
jgi:hypothetical protein